jgi:hypothetical protein
MLPLSKIFAPATFYVGKGKMQVRVDGCAKQFKLAAETKAAADGLISPLTQNLRETFGAAHEKWTLEMDITCLRKSPSLAKLRILAKTLDELRPVLLQYLQHPTIVCNTRLQRLLIALVFKIHRPATPIHVVMQTPVPNSCA